MMNDFLESISQVLSISLGSSALILLTSFFNLDLEFKDFLYTIWIFGGVVSIFIAIFFKIRNQKTQNEIDKIRKKKAEDEANGKFMFNLDYTEDE